MRTLLWMIWMASVAMSKEGCSEYFASPQGAPAICAVTQVSTP